MNAHSELVSCGDCKHFVRNGKCGFTDTAEYKAKDRPFEHAPFWCWSDYDTDRELVHSAATSACATFAERAP